MSFNKKFFTTGGIVAASGVCRTEDVNPFTGTSADNGVALYSLDYDASDASGNYDGSPSNVTFGVGGAIGNYGARFNGSSSKINTGYQIPSGLSGFSVSAWVKAASVKTQYIVGDLGSGGNAPDGMFQINISSSNVLRASVGGVNSQTIATLSGYTNTWTHIVVTTDSSGNIIGYVNGSQVGTASGNSLTSNTEDFVIGMFGNATSHSTAFNGDIDQVRLFESELTSDQVETLYAETACVYTATTTDNDYPTTNVAYYKLDNSAEDEKGSYDGTETDIEYRFGRYGQAAVFNGSTSTIDISTTTTTPINFASEVFSVSLWIKVNSLSHENTFLGKYGVTANASTHRSILMKVDTSGQFVITENDGSSIYTQTSTATISANTYTFFAYTRSGSTSKIYINDNSAESQSRTNTIKNGSTQELTIGGVRSGVTDLDGDLDQVRLFSSTLTDDQVSQLYNEKPETDTSNFKTVLYTGDGGSQYISNVGMDLETNGGLVWIKSRDVASSHTLHDSVRGYDTDGTGGANSYKPLHSDATTAETTFNSTWHNNFGFLNSLEANGFTVVNGIGSASDNYNKDDEDYVAWVWKGGGDAVSTNNNGNAQITADVSANTEAGFSIVKYTVTNALNQTVYHGLDEAPEIVITKRTDLSEDWFIFTSVIPGQDHHYLIFDTDGKATSSIDPPNDDYIYSRQNGTIINYCFHSVSGYSQIGVYSGNGSTNGPEITTGFKPSWIMIKRIDISGHSWLIYDSRRSGSDFADDLLYADESLAENPLSNRFEFKDTSFKILTNNASHNAIGTNNYLYMVFK